MQTPLMVRKIAKFNIIHLQNLTDMSVSLKSGTEETDHHVSFLHEIVTWLVLRVQNLITSKLATVCFSYFSFFFYQEKNVFGNEYGH